MGWLMTTILARIVEAEILGSQGHLPSRKVVVRPAWATSDANSRNQSKSQSTHADPHLGCLGSLLLWTTSVWTQFSVLWRTHLGEELTDATAMLAAPRITRLCPDEGCHSESVEVHIGHCH